MHDSHDIDPYGPPDIGLDVCHEDAWPTPPEMPELPHFDLGIEWCRRCGQLPADTVVATLFGDEHYCSNPLCQDGTVTALLDGPLRRTSIDEVAR